MTPYANMMSKISSPVARYVVALLLGIILLIPIAVYTVFAVIWLVISSALYHNPISAYKGEFD